MVKYTFRPLGDWPGRQTPSGARRSIFRAPHSETIHLLNREMEHLGATRAVIQVALDEGDLRRDGLPRASARPSHPGVVLSFESTHGHLQYATDRYTSWQENLRAIALGLEALRKVDRYGITKRGEQYRGWRQIEASSSTASELEKGRAIIARYGGVAEALKATHPDRGGDPDDFHAVQIARERAAEARP